MREFCNYALSRLMEEPHFLYTNFYTHLTCLFSFPFLSHHSHQRHHFVSFWFYLSPPSQGVYTIKDTEPSFFSLKIRCSHVMQQQLYEKSYKLHTYEGFTFLIENIVVVSCSRKLHSHATQTA